MFVQDSETEGGSDGVAEGIMPSCVYNGHSESAVVVAVERE
jgi:hypothetical protein